MDSNRKSVLSDNQYTGHLFTIEEIGSKNFKPKSAFNYDFINVMQKILHRPQLDFKVLGSSLEAATKLYSTRIDEVSLATRKVLASIGMVGVDEYEGDDNFNDSLEGMDGEEPKKKKKPKKVVATIATNPETLKGKLDTIIEMDPLFYHLSASFDVCNVKSLLLANLHITSDGNLIVDSKASLNFDNLPPVESQASPFHFREVQPTQDRSFRSFSDFSFANREDDEEDSFIEQEKVFVPDLDCPVSEIPAEYEMYNEDFQGSTSHLDSIGQSQGDLDGMDADASIDVDTPMDEEGNTSYVALEKKAADISVLIQSGSVKINDLINILPSQSDDNLFFDPKFLKRVFTNVSSFVKPQPNKRPTGPRKPRVGLEENVYSLDDLDDDIFKQTEQFELTKNTLNKWKDNSDVRALPEDLGIEPSKLTNSFFLSDPFFEMLFNKLNLEDYSCENMPKHNKANPTDKKEDDDDGVDPDDDGLFGLDNNEDSLGDGGQAESAPLDSAADFQKKIQSRFSVFDSEATPVEALDIDYSKVSKKVDIKKVKSKMWEIIDVEADFTCNSQNVTSSQKKPLEFINLRQELPKLLNPTLNENLSTPASFVALLHLCNEKNLALEADKNMNNFIIQKDI